MRLVYLAALAASLSAQNQNTPEGPGVNWNQQCYPINAPLLEKAPAIDGDLAEWKDYAFTDGVWDIYRVMHTPWFDPGRNRLTDHGNEPRPEDDLSARYYIAWDKR